MYILQFPPDDGMHCVKIVTSKYANETSVDNLHLIDVLVRFNTGNTLLFTWKGVKKSASQKEICQEYEKDSGLVYVTGVWIRQQHSNNTWYARSIHVQENAESPSYEQYVFHPEFFEFWTDG